MSSMGSFMDKFGGGQRYDSETLGSPSLPHPTGGLTEFLAAFSTLTEDYLFYNGTETLRYDVDKHVYFRVDPELGNLIELSGVTDTLKIIDKSAALVPWSSKMCVEKLLRTIPLADTPDEFGDLRLAPMTLIEFTKLAMEAKGAHKEKLDDAGNIGHIGHKCLEDSIQYAIDHTGGIVLELRNVPTDEKAKACAEAGLAWMQAHGVRWICTERKVYSKEYAYAGTADGLAWINSCTDLSCCTEKYTEHLALVDWKTSNDLHIEYCYQAAAYLQALLEEFRK